MNDSDRAEWIDNDEGLYLWWQSQRFRMSKRAFIRFYRKEITTAIQAVLDVPE